MKEQMVLKMSLNAIAMKKRAILASDNQIQLKNRSKAIRIQQKQQEKQRRNKMSKTKEETRNQISSVCFLEDFNIKFITSLTPLTQSSNP
jgi:GTP cyclohydrolase II